MDWTELSLENIPAIVQECDVVVSRYQKLVESVQGESTEQSLRQIVDLRDSINNRIQALEDFYLDNEIDERAMMLEKQRLKLRKLLREDTVFASLMKQRLESSTASPARHDQPTHSSWGVPHPPSVPPPDVDEHKAAPPTSARGMKTGKAAVSHPSQMAPVIKEASAEPKKQPRIKPIYKWETQSKQPQESPLSYPATPPPLPVAPRSFEFQIKLTPEEFEELQRRRLASGYSPYPQQRAFTGFLHKGEGNTSAIVPKPLPQSGADGESPFVTSTGPYTNPSAAIFRSVEREKWVGRQDFMTAIGTDK